MSHEPHTKFVKFYRLRICSFHELCPALVDVGTSNLTAWQSCSGASGHLGRTGPRKHLNSSLRVQLFSRGDEREVVDVRLQHSLLTNVSVWLSRW